MGFKELKQQYEKDIAVTAYSQSIPGLDYDDVVSEMTICLWRAGETWREDFGVSFGAYWWSLWKNRQADLLREGGRQKRPRTVAVPEVREVSDRSYMMVLFPDPPSGATREQQMIWRLLCAGESVKNIIDLMRISRRAYYKCVSQWRTTEVRSMLAE